MPDEIVIVDANGVEHVFPGEMDPSRAAAIVRRSAKAPVASVRSQPARTWTDTAVDALPTIGGTLGGIVGGIGGTVAGMGVGGVPGAVAGAAVGGAGGEGFRQTINVLRGKPLPTSMGEQVTDIASEGALQGASELAGAGLMKAGGMAAHGLMDFAIRPTPTMAKEFGDIAATAIKERLPVGSVLPGGRRGSNMAREAMRESGKTTRGLLQRAEDAGERLSPAAIARDPVRDLVMNAAEGPLSQGEITQVATLFEQYLREKPSSMTPRAVKAMKQAAQSVARPIYKAINAGNLPPAGEQIKAKFNEAIASGAKQALESLPVVGKDVATSEARTKGLIGATQAIRQSEVRRMPLLVEMAAPIAGAVAGGAASGDIEGAGKGITTAVVSRALLSPRTTSRAALGLTNAQLQQALRQMPRSAVYALLAQLTGTTAEGQSPE